MSNINKCWKVCYFKNIFEKPVLWYLYYQRGVISTSDYVNEIILIDK